ncbi:cation diffusion facilitator family transporter [Thermocrinis sp.]
MKKEHWALVSLSVNLLQTLLKLIGGLFSGSLSLIGEAIHSLSDSFASIVAYLTLKFSDRKSARFPYGLYKLENVGSFVIGIFLLLAAYEIIKRALTERVSIKEEGWSFGVVVVVFSLFSSLTLSFLERRAAKKYNSPTLLADSYHTLTDAFGSSLVLMSFLSVYLGHQLDRYFAVAVSLLIIWTAVGILRKEMGVLLDVSADEKTLQKIREVILSFEDVVEIKNLFVRSSGGKLFADITLTLSGINFEQMHSLVDELENKLKKEINELEMVFIHYEPAETCTPRVGILLNSEKEVASKFDDSRHLLVFCNGGSRLIESLPEDELGISREVVKHSINILVSGHHPETQEAKLMLSKAGVFVWETEEKNPYKALSQIASGLGIS